MYSQTVCKSKKDIIFLYNFATIWRNKNDNAMHTFNFSISSKIDTSSIISVAVYQLNVAQ